MRIIVTDNDGVLLDQIDVAEEIGDLSKPMPVAALIERLRDCAKEETADCDTCGGGGCEECCPELEDTESH